MSNTSSVDVEWVEDDEEPTVADDEEQQEGHANIIQRSAMWKEFKKAQYVEGILEPGDGLYIPVSSTCSVRA